MEGLGVRYKKRYQNIEELYFEVIQTEKDADAAAFIRDAQYRNKIFDVNMQDPRSLSKNPMLHQAASRGKALTCAAILENRDIWFHQQNTFNETALDLAIRRKDFNCCAVLMRFLVAQYEQYMAGKPNQYRPLHRAKGESKEQYGYRTTRLLGVFQIEVEWNGHEMIFHHPNDYAVTTVKPGEILEELRVMIDERLLAEYTKDLYDEEHQDEMVSDSEEE